jgi:pimeloyl-ACP methyl ester carboxylesterase
LAFIEGKEDIRLPKSERASRSPMARGSQIHYIKGSAHFPMLENPEELEKILGGFLDAKGHLC